LGKPAKPSERVDLAFAWILWDRNDGVDGPPLFVRAAGALDTQAQLLRPGVLPLLVAEVDTPDGRVAGVQPSLLWVVVVPGCRLPWRRGAGLDAVLGIAELQVVVANPAYSWGMIR